MNQETKPVINNGYADDSMFFSAKDVAFYPGRYYDRYVAAGNWPVDAKPVTLAVFTLYTSQAPRGKMRGVDSDGNPTWIQIVEPVLTNEQASALLNSRINFALDFVAKEWGYDKGIDNATTWSTSSNPQFAAEAKALSAWRDAVWAWAAAQPAGMISREGAPNPPDRPVITNAGAAA